jgi:hypothetical protein
LELQYEKTDEFKIQEKSNNVKPALTSRDGRHDNQADCSPGRTIRLSSATTRTGFTGNTWGRKRSGAQSAATAARLAAALTMGTAAAAAIGGKFGKLVRTGLPDFDHIHIKTESFAGQRMIEINSHGVIYGIHPGHTDHDRTMGALGLKGHAWLDLAVIRELFHGDVLKQILTDRTIGIFRLNDYPGAVTDFHAHQSIFQAGNNLS